MTTDSVVGDICERLNIGASAFSAALDEAVAVLLKCADRPKQNSVAAAPLQVGVAAGTAGVWRISGETTGGHQFSLVLKGLWNETGPHGNLWGITTGAPNEPFHWRREASVYESKLLDRSGQGEIRRPNCLALIEPDGVGHRRRIGIFMEEAQGKSGADASVEELTVVARRLGAMQGAQAIAYMQAKPPIADWFADRYPRAYVGRVESLVAETDDFEEWSLPLLRPFVNRTFGGRNLRDGNDELWADRYRYLSSLEALPTITLSHNDLWPAQIITSDAETVIFDFAALGIGPLGYDLGKLATEVMVRDMPTLDACREIDHQFLAGYLAGMGEQGVAVSNPVVEKLVALGFTAGLAAMESYRLRGDWVQLALGNARANAVRSQWADRMAEQVFDFYADRTIRLLEHAETATRLGRELAAVLGQPLPASELLA